MIPTNTSVENWTNYLELWLVKHRQNQGFTLKPCILKWTLHHHSFKGAFFFSDLEILKWPIFYQLAMDEMSMRVSFFLKKSTHAKGPALNT